MLKVNNLSLRFNTRTLFENVNLEFNGNNCYGIIGANGAGKSTFLKILSGSIESTTGEVIIGKGERISVLKQNHNEFDDMTVIDVVIMGNNKLYQIIITIQSDLNYLINYFYLISTLFYTTNKHKLPLLMLPLMQ